MKQIPVLQGLSTNSWKAIAELEGAVFIHLRTQDRLIGLLVLGHRSSQVPYSNEDISLLVTVSNHAALAIENARLYSVERERVAELQTLTQMKASFLLTVAHQLKTPLSAIKASAGMLDEVIGEHATTSQKRLLANVERGTQSLEIEIGKPLEFLKIKTAAVKLDLETMDIREIIRETVEQALPAIKSKGQTLTLHMPEVRVLAYVDRSRVEAILLNLVGNANKFTQEHGQIEVRLEKLESHFTVAVEDNGPGISPEALAHLFESFYEVKDVGGNMVGSSGLGLAIAKSLVELIGGQLWVHSHVGVGSQFYFSLPLKSE